MSTITTPWVQTASGKAFPLIGAEAALVDFPNDIAAPLARSARFSGHIGSGPYSVAQHSVEGADALLRETCDKRLAALFLLHDAHEAYIGDIATPVKAALADLAGTMGGEQASALMRQSFKALSHHIDEAIHKAAGLALADEAEGGIIKAMDIRMLITERNHLLGPSPQPWAPVFEAAQPIRRNGRLRVWPWPDAADEFMARAQRWLPCFTKNRRAA
jgi:5'-deoxynucleotidase YfbR-like HD superfamily hydrolase